jgi:iron complex outermembrane recepter protein
MWASSYLHHSLVFTSIIFLWAMLTISTADPVLVTGRVTDKSTGMPLERATILIVGQQRGTVTDSTGAYTLSISTGSTVLEYRYVGYKAQRHTAVLVKDTVIDVALEPDVSVSKSVEIQAERNPRVMTSTTGVTLSEQELDRNRGQTLGETLAGIVGVDVLQTGASIAKPVIRGLHSDRVITMQSGLTQEGQQWGGEHAPEIDPFSPGRIEVIKGAAGVEYGIGAIGGVIRVIPRAIDFTKPLSGSVLLNGYSSNLQGAASINLEGSPYRNSNLSWRFQSSVRKAGDYRTPGYVVDNSGFQELSMNTLLAFKTGAFNHRVYLSTFNTELGIYTGAHFGSPSDLQRAIDRGGPVVEQPFTYSIKAPKQQIRHHLVSAESSLFIDHVGALDIHYGLQQNNRKEFDAHGRFGRELTEAAFDLTLTTQTLDLRLQHLSVLGLDGKVGLQLKRQGNVRNSVGFLIPDFRSNSAGLYVIESKTVGDVRFEAGGRIDYLWNRVYSVRSPRIEGRTDNWLRPSGALGLIWNIADDFELSATVGSAWRPAGVNERFSYGVHHGTAQYEIGDANLKPEFATNVEVGLSWEVESGGVRLNAWNSSIKDFVQLRPDGTIVSTIRGAFPLYLFQQYDAALRGLELSLHVHPVNFYESAVKGTMLRGENKELNEPLYMMPASNVAWINNFVMPVNSTFRQNTLQIGLRSVARQTRYPMLVQTDSYREPQPPRGYSLLDMGLSSNIRLGRQQFDLSIDAKNILNTSYRDYLSRFRYLIDEPGRNIVIRMAIQF